MWISAWNELKTIGQSIRQKNRKRYLFEIFFYDTYNDKIILAHREGFVINIFNSNGDLTNSIKKNYKPVQFTKKDKADVIKYWEYTPPYKSKIDFFKKATIFPKNYPPILTCCVNNNKIYIVTYEKNKKKKNKTVLYNLDGKFLGNKFVPLVMNGPSEAYPFTIFNNKFYQIVDNYENDVWELHISKIE